MLSLALLARRSSVNMTRVVGVRSQLFSIQREINQEGGRRKEELDAEAAGEVAFNNEPIIPDTNAGTKENPILVPSGEGARAVGFEDPLTHQLAWFTLSGTALHYIPSIGLFFKLKPIGH